MSVTKTILFPPVFIESDLPYPLQRWLQSVQNLLPLNVCDTTSGPITVALPPAGVNQATVTTGASNQNQEIIYIKSTADANTVTITGGISGDVVLSTQWDVARFKSDGTNWYASPNGPSGPQGPQGIPGPAPSGAANEVLATPDGAPGVSSLRALVVNDIPQIPVTKLSDTPAATFVLAGPASGPAAQATFRALAATDLTFLSAIATSGKWSDLQNATAALTLANGANPTTFNQTSAVAWKWANLTPATSLVAQNSPLLEVAGQYWTGAAWQKICGQFRM